MIVGSLLLIVVAIAFLAMGLVNGSNTYLVGSIAASLLAAIGLVVSSRQASAARASAEEESASEEPAADQPPAEEPAADQPASGYADSDRHEDRLGAERDGDRPGEHEPMTEVMPAIGAGVDERAAAEETQWRRPPVAVRPVIPAQGGARDLSRAHAGRLLLDNELDGVDGVDGVDDEEPPDEPVAQQVSAGEAARVGRMSNDVLVIDGRPRYHLAGCVHLLGRASEPLPVREAIELGFTPCGLCEPDSALLAEARRV